MLNGVKDTINNCFGKMLIQCFIGDNCYTEACLLSKSSKIINAQLIDNRTILETIVPIRPYFFRKRMPWFTRGIGHWFFQVFY
jgi:hypothetical protein